MQEKQAALPDIEVYGDERPEYHPLMVSGTWMVAQYNAAQKDLPEYLPRLDRHRMTDEVFVLLCGDCLLLSAGDADAVGTIEGVQMRPGLVYNVRKDVWHAHIMTPGSTLLIVENAPEGNRLTDKQPVTPEMRQRIVQLSEPLFAQKT